MQSLQISTKKKKVEETFSQSVSGVFISFLMRIIQYIFRLE